tara:strand:+ start:38 stop:199 length:162 start_codon:yes stop_codon:yes gene_type:complete
MNRILTASFVAAATGEKIPNKMKKRMIVRLVIIGSLFVVGSSYPVVLVCGRRV